MASPHEHGSGTAPGDKAASKNANKAAEDATPGSATDSSRSWKTRDAEATETGGGDEQRGKADDIPRPSTRKKWSKFFGVTRMGKRFMAR